MKQREERAREIMKRRFVFREGQERLEENIYQAMLEFEEAGERELLVALKETQQLQENESSLYASPINMLVQVNNIIQKAISNYEQKAKPNKAE